VAGLFLHLQIKDDELMADVRLDNSFGIELRPSQQLFEKLAVSPSSVVSSTSHIIHREFGCIITYQGSTSKSWRLKCSSWVGPPLLLLLIGRRSVPCDSDLRATAISK
jgi:hypothetical protein